MNVNIPLLGIGVRAPKPKQEESVYSLACATAEKLGCAGVVRRSDVVANTDYVGEGYGIPAESTIEAIRLFAELEGILLDPVYSGQAPAGLGDLRSEERRVGKEGVSSGSVRGSTYIDKKQLET